VLGCMAKSKYDISHCSLGLKLEPIRTDCDRRESPRLNHTIRVDVFLLCVFCDVTLVESPAVYLYLHHNLLLSYRTELIAASYDLFIYILV
jgi:hypothetical protein